MLNWIRRWRAALLPAGRRKPRSRRDCSPQLHAALQVRMLEERRVFHADAVVAPAETQEPPPPPATTTVTLDADQNLLVQDVSSTGQNDQLRVRFDVESGFYEISDPSQLLHTDIEDATGSGTHQLYIPALAIGGERLIFQTGAGEDSLSVDLSGGLGGKSLHFDGGAGEADSLTLLGGSHSVVGYVFGGDGSTQIDAGGSLLTLNGVEPIFDYLSADSRQFTLGAGLQAMSLGDDGIAANGNSQVSMSLGTSVTFASPLHSLSLDGGGSGQSLSVTGLDSKFAGDLHVDAGDAGHVALSGSIDLAGGDLYAAGDTLHVSGSLATSGATIDLAARSSLTVAAEGLIENHGGRVLLDAGAEGTLQFSGRIDARGLMAGQAGGTVYLLGRQVELLGTASIDVSGTLGGGTVLVGGDYQGLNPLVRTATNTLVQSDVSIRANGLGSADGGKIIVWADEAAVVAGSGNLQARGGEFGGDGGLIETSGKQYLEIRGAADASSPYGTAGTWLLDPVSLSIVTTSSQTLDGSGSFTSASGSTEIAASTIVAALQGTDGTNGTNVTINTGSGTGGAGNITVDEEISVALGAMTTRTLTLNAHGTIDVNEAITATSGMLNVALNANLAAAGGDISLDAAITTGGGSLTTSGDTFENTDAVISTSGGNVTLNHTGAVTIAANMTLGAGTATIDGSSIAFSTTVAATLSAQIANLTASGAITSGLAANDIVVSGMSAAIALSGSALGASTAPLAINPGGGTVALSAATGGIFIDVTAGDFTAEQLTTLSAAGDGVAIVLRALGGDLEIDKVSQFNANTANDLFTLTSTTGDVILSAPTALAAATAALTATTGDITATSSGPHLATSGAGTAITLTSAGKIGASGAAIGVQAGAGTVTATTTSTDAADGVYLASTGALQLGAIVTDATAMQTVVITTTGMDAHLTIAAASSTNDDWTLTASGNIGFGASGQLTAKSASLTAGGTITGSSATASDIDTSAANGAITLSGTSLGAPAQPLQLRPGTGSLDLMASTGGVFVNLDAGDLLTSRLSLDVAGAGQTIALSTTDGAMTFNSTANFVATSDDNFVVSAGGMAKNIAFSGMTTLSANSISLTASGAITSGTAATDVQTAAMGTLTLSAGGDIGGSTNQLNMQAGGTISAMAGGDIHLRQVTGNLATSAFTALTSTKMGGGLVSIGTLAGAVSVDTVAGLMLADDTLEIVAGGMGSNISLGTTLSAGLVRLNAAGDITSAAMSSAADVSAASGIELIAGGGIGASANPLVVQTTAGTITATTSGSGAAGSIYLESPLALPLGGITTDAATTQTVSLRNTTGDFTIAAAVSSNDDWILDSAGNIAFGPLGSLSVHSVTLTAGGTITGSSGSGTDIDTSAANGAITLSGTSLGASGQPLQLRAGTGALDLTASTGGVFVNLDAGDLVTSRLTLDVQAANQTIALSTSAGGVALDSVAGFTNTADDDFQITSGGSGRTIAFSGMTTLVGRSIALSASGDITSGDAAVDVDTGALGGAISLFAGGGIGAAASPLVVQSGAGSITAATTGAGAAGSIFLQSPVALPFGAITTDAASTQTVSLTNTAGNLTIGTAIASNDDWILNSAGDIAFGPLGSLTAHSASLTAGGAITGSSAATTDIDTSAANGAITLSGTSLGASAQPLQLRAGTGTLDLTASTGGVFVNLDAGDLLTSRLSLDVQGAGQTIVLSTSNGAITFDSTANFVATSDDNFVVTAGGLANDIAFSGMTTLSGHSVSLTASGAITSGTATTDVQTAATGTLALSAGGDIGGSTNPLNVQAGGTISAMAGGDIYLRQVTGNLATSAFTTLTSTQVGATVSIGTLAGSVSVDTVAGLMLADDTLEIVAGDSGSNIAFGTTLSAGMISLNAAGNITSTPMSSAVDVSAISGIELIAGGSIGAAGNPLVVQTTAGTVTATTSGAGAAGSIYLESPVALPLGGITTDAATTQTVSLRNTTGNFTIAAAVTSNDDWILDSAGNIAFGPLGSLSVHSATLIAGGTITGSSGSATDINTSAANGTISLTANSLGTLAAPLQLNAGTGNLVLTARTGGVFVNLDAGELRTSRLALDVQAANQTIALSTSAGAVAIDSVTGFTNTADDDFQITSGGGQDIAFSGITTLVGRSITLTASGDITSGGAAVDVDTSALGGAVTLSADGGIGAAGDELRFQAGGLLTATAGGGIHLRQAAGDLATSKFALLNSTGVGSLVSIGTVNGSVTVDTTAGLVIADDTLEIVAGNQFGSLGDITLNATLTAGAARLIAAGTIQSGNAGLIDINTSALGGDITLLAGGPIGSSVTPISVSAGALGDVSATTTGAAASGDIYLTSIGPLRLGAFTTDAATSQTVSLATTGGDFTIAAASATNDQWILNSSANIAFSGPGSLSAASASLTAAGQITSGTANIDINTAAFNGPITLSAASIGTAGNSLVINAGSAPLSVTATSGDVFLTQFSGDLALSQFTTLSLAGNNATLNLHVRNGNLLIDKTPDASTQNDRLQLSAAGAGGFIAFLDDPAFLPVTLVGSEVTLTATADILNFSSFPGVPNIDTAAAGGTISLTGRSLGLLGLPLQVRPGAGDLSLVATSGGMFVNVTSGNLNAAQLSASAAGANQTIAISTTSGHIELSGDSFAANTADDHLMIQAGGAASDITFNGTPIVANSARIVAGNSIVSTQTGTDATIVGLLDLQATLGSIGAAGAGNSFTFTAGQLITQSAGPQYLQQPLATDQTIVVSAVSGGDMFLLRGGYLVAGDITSLGTVTVAPDVLLGGNGTVAGSAIVIAGIVDPGYFPGTLTTDGDAEALTLAGNVTITREGTLVFDVNPPYMTPGIDYDHLIVMGALNLETPELELKGGRQLQQSINGIELISATNPVMGQFAIGGSVVVDDRTRTLKAVVGSFRGDLIFNGPAGFGVVIGDLSLVPPIQQTGVRLPAIRLPVFTRIDRPLPPPVPPPPLTPPSEPPPLEVETEAPKLRELEVRIVVPIDDAGNFREQVVMKLPAEMLTDLPALFRRLPDDRYRIYLMLEGSAEERLVIDVVVRDGRPMEPGSLGEAAGEALPLPPAADPHVEPADRPAALPLLPAAPPAAPSPAGVESSARGSAPARLFAGMGLAAAAVVASRRAGGWTQEVDAAAEQIGKSSQPHWRWWSKSAARADRSRHN